MNKLLATLFTIMCMFMSEVVVAAIAGINHITLTDNSHEGEAFVFISVQIVSWIICEVIGMFANISEDITMPKSFNLTVIFLCVALYLLEISIFMQEDIGRNIKMLSVICMMLVLFLVIYLYDSLSKNIKKEMQAEIIEREKNYYYKQAELLQQSSRELRNFRHDMKNHLYVLQSMMDCGNEEVEKYLASLTDKLEKATTFSNTGNLALDSVVNYKLGSAKRDGIEIVSNIVVPRQVKIQSEDLVTVLGNLLDNAIDAQKNVKDKYIHLYMKYSAGVVFITVKNSYDGMVIRSKGKILTKKENKSFHGIGLKSVQSTVDQYHGTMDIAYDDTEFVIKIMLYTE